MHSDRLTHIFVFLILLVSLGIGLACWLVPQYTVNDTTIAVTDKTVKLDNNRSRYLVFDSGDMYEITDAVYVAGPETGRFRFDSSTLYGRLEIGQTYDVRTVGVRVPILSWYPNIVEAHNVDPRLELNDTD